MDSSEVLQPALRVALAWHPGETRAALQAVLELDAQLARIVAQAREGVLAQMRLAWWRERLSQPEGARLTGNPLLASLETRLAGAQTELAALVDGWEELLGEAPLPETAIDAFADGRADALAAIARCARVEPAGAELARRAARRWALADFAFRTSDERERAAALALARATPPPGRLPRQVRGIAVLGALADRAIDRHEPVLAGRIAPLIALRVGMTGR
ncbi:hypothetical protein N0B51_06680 [Tsuneonella sp. YG55]|uniref:Phytoene synthase n=1 Tax=Tsuneonella litorea TaxID=2976475 RepID=A0A9X3A7Q8_9SPHN|nr:hypothetical protein [Tsuneonella litorea]MCT2558661.1 hypothetical protein [Tsuneonella litorea]